MDYFLNLIIICVTITFIKSDDDCKAIVPDAINRLKNQTLVIFQDKNMWFLELQNNGQPNVLTGPCLINKLMPDMRGPIDAAVTFENHEFATEFIGTSIYFTEEKFYTYKNLKSFLVQWADRTVIPFSDKQNKFSSQLENKTANDIMKTQMSAAYYDMNSHRINLIFTSGKVLAYSLELSYEFDEPDISDIDIVLNKFGVPSKTRNITAAITLTKEKQVFFFEGSTYCAINYDLSDKANAHQTCSPLPVSDFIGCANIIRKKVCPDIDRSDSYDLKIVDLKSNDTNDSQIAVQSPAVQSRVLFSRENISQNPALNKAIDSKFIY